ncbi:hypothetical protein O181_012751 [Austropuccinia psidii MF-1]|uniref:Uncharacterized protein n=1 Tax=Austropuccinia psidii MF-1 TaxID=1389203 RepID=A0A9Q3GML2_9BASI|nr:hypothetical protein [Austropuccinia psidii MF-1]
METIIDGRTLREIIPIVPFTLQFNGKLKPEDWKDMDQALQLHKLLKHLFQWRMDNKRLNLALSWAELGEFCHKVFLNKITFKDLIVITYRWIPNRKFKLLEERAARIRENKATIQAIQEQLNQKENTLIPSGSQEVDQLNSPVASQHKGTRRSVAKSHHCSKTQVLFRRRQESKGKNKTSFNQSQEKSDAQL